MWNNNVEQYMNNLFRYIITYDLRNRGVYFGLDGEWYIDGYEYAIKIVYDINDNEIDSYPSDRHIYDLTKADRIRVTYGDLEDEYWVYNKDSGFYEEEY